VKADIATTLAYPYPFYLSEGSIDDPPDNGETLPELMRRAKAVLLQNGMLGRWLQGATRHRCLQILEAERRYQAAFRTKGRRGPRGATETECLFALAKRLGVPTGKCDPKADRFPDLQSAPWKELRNAVAERLIITQQEFWTLMETSSPGRPSGARNKQIKTAVTKEALRQRRRRQNKQKRDKYSI
jgi:hypothetical protein